MASVFEKFANGGRGCAESTLMLATMAGGHFFNIVSDKELDNGNVVAYPDPTNGRITILLRPLLQLQQMRSFFI